VGVLFWLVGSPDQDVLSPGDLTFKHGTVAETCGACHTADMDKRATWAHLAVGEHGGIPESHRCLECHGLGQNALDAHGLSVSTLEDAHRRIREQEVPPRPPLSLALARLWPGQPQATGDQLACALCHREHQGADAKLSRMDDQRCQACHTIQFPSFSNGHPEFAGYPYSRRTRLHYDHVSHLGRHFQESRRIMPSGKAPATCLACHEQGPGGRMMLVRSFEQTCASCHRGQIEDTTLGGIAVLNLPGLDLQTLAKLPGPQLIGEWPESASADLSPFMRLLLSTNERFVQAEKVLHGKIDLRDLRVASAEQLQSVAQYVWAIKELFLDLTQDEASAWRRRLEKVFGQELDGHERSFLTGDLPLELVRDAQQRWLPGLEAEVAAHRADKLLPKKTDTQPPPGGPLSGEAKERWYRNDVDFSIRYRPKGHAGEFMYAWLNRSANPRPLESAAPLRAIFASLSDPAGPGRCTKCHGVENDGQEHKINWLASREMPSERPFTKFAHVPHFSLLGEQGCLTCHILNETADVARGFVRRDYSLNTNPKILESSFVPISKAVCAKCHVQKAAGDSCLICHNYHVGNLPPAMPKATFHASEDGQRKDTSAHEGAP
jgi:hypothetical protein